MCLDPITLTALALGAGGIALNASAQKDVNKKRNSVARREAGRQKQFQANADAITDKNIERFDRGSQEENINRQAAVREEYLKASMPGGGGSGVPVSDGAPAVVRSDLGKRIADALSYGKNFATSSARLGAYGANQFDNNIALGRSGIELGQIGNSSARSSDISGLELEAANQAGAGKRQLADLFRLGSMVAGGVGMTGVPGTAASSFSTSTAPNLAAMGGGQGLNMATGAGQGFNMARSGLGLRFQ